MSVTYFKRYRMEIRLNQAVSMAGLPSGYELFPWSPRLLDDHAEVKCASFGNEIDSQVFPCLADLEGCRNLMREITSRSDFVSEATWLLVQRGSHSVRMRPVGTIQGLRASAREGAIQNIGIHPDSRNLGLGTVLIQAALRGFRQVGCRSVHLEVTVQNTAAIRLYQRLGFRTVETLYKIAEVQYA